jgi:hypothetical protein
MRVRVAVVTGVVALFVGACGGGGGGEQLTAAEFREQADAICARYEGELDELGTPSSLEDLQQFVAKAVPIIEEGNAELSELQPPAELEEPWNRALEINREQLAVVRDLRGAVEEGDQERVEELLQQGDEASAEDDELATQMGLEQCGNE